MISVGEAIPGQRSVCGGKPGPVVLGQPGDLGSLEASRKASGRRRGPVALRLCLWTGLLLADLNIRPAMRNEHHQFG